MDETKRIIEIGGVKMEIDLRTAKRLDTFRVGDRVKILVKEYTDRYSSHHGVIVAFDDFKALPTITVCYIKTVYGDSTLNFAAINANTEGIEIAACNDAVLVEKNEVLARLQAEVDKRMAEIEDLRRKMRYFEDRFGAWFSPTDGQNNG